MHKKRNLILSSILVLAIAAILVVIFVVKPDSEPTTLSSGSRPYAETTSGNANGNIVNGGVVAKAGDWIYYSDLTDHYYMYRMNTISGDSELWLENSCVSINIVDDWIYYSDWSGFINSKDYDGSGRGFICKVRTDGTGKEKLNSELSHYVNVVDGWIYYQNSKENGALYKMHTDGTGKEQLNSDKCYYINVVNDWIYYSNKADNDTLYRIHTDGTNREQLTDSSVKTVIVIGDWIYYMRTEEPLIYRIHTDGTNEEQINTDESGVFNVSGDWIYYSNLSDNDYLYKIRTDGTGKEQLNSDGIGDIYIVDDWIYYLLSDSEKSLGYSECELYRILTDGTQRQKIS